MARPRTATNILEARGAFKKNPNRSRPNEPRPDTKFPNSAPKHLSTKQKKCWDEIVSIAPAGVLTGADTLIVEIIAILLEEFRANKGRVSMPHISRLTSEMAKIGLSPSARASLSVDKPKGNDFDDV